MLPPRPASPPLAALPRPASAPFASSALWRGFECTHCTRGRSLDGSPNTSSRNTVLPTPHRHYGRIDLSSLQDRIKISTSSGLRPSNEHCVCVWSPAVVARFCKKERGQFPNSFLHLTQSSHVLDGHLECCAQPDLTLNQIILMTCTSS